MFGLRSKIDIATIILNDVKSVQADLKDLTSQFPVIRKDVQGIRDVLDMNEKRVSELDKRLRALEDQDMREKAGWSGPQKVMALILSAVPLIALALAYLSYIKR